MIGKLDGCPIVTSETCALDIIGARYVRDVENGEIVVFSDEGAQLLKPFPPMRPRPCIFEYIYFARPDSVVGGRSVYQIRRRLGIELDIGEPLGDGRRRGAGAGFGRAGGDRLFPGGRHPLHRARHHPQPLCGPHGLHPADPVDPRARRAHESTMPTAR